MIFSSVFHYFQIDENFFGGEEPPYRPEFDSGKKIENPEMQSMFDDFCELLENFQVFIDLREEDEPYYEYGKSLPDGIVYERFPIKDVDIPESPEQLHPLICRISEHVEAGKMVYLHCHGGRGRTGIVAGCWLAHRYHLTGAESALKLSKLFANSSKGRQKKSCPETRTQLEFILNYADWCEQKRNPLRTRCSTR